MLRNSNSRMLGVAAALALLGGTFSAAATELKYFQTFTNVDYTSAGVGGLREVGYGTINLTGVTGTVTKAFLYWHGHLTQNPQPSATTGVAYLNGVPVTGTLIGTSGSDGWSFSPFFQVAGQAFRADVTSLVTSNGSYLVSNFTPMRLTVQGASLVVIYDDGNPSNNRDIVIVDGCDQNSANPYDALGWNISFPGINYNTGDAVDLEFHVSDGQSAYLEGVINLNGQLLAPAQQSQVVIDPNTGKPAAQLFAGTAPYSITSGFRYSYFTGSLWDINTFDIVPLLSPGINSLYLTADYVDDDLTVVAVVAKLKAGGAVIGGTSNNPPVISCSGAANYSCAGTNGVTHTATATVSDTDGDALSLTWRLDGTVQRIDSVPAGVATNPTAYSLTVNLPLGTHDIQATVQDSAGFVSSCVSIVNVQVDTTAPTVICAAPLIVQADTNGNYTLPNILISATDDCSVQSTSQSPPAGPAVGTGSVTVTVSATDSSGNVGSCSATIAINRPPVANADLASTGPGQAVSIPVLANDSDPDNDPLTVVANGYTQPANGILTLGANGVFTYTPAAGFTGTDTFQYTISDGRGGTATATVTILVIAPKISLPPVAVADSASTTVGVAVTINVLANDYDQNTPPLPLSIQSFTQSANGTVTAGASGTLIFTPSAGFTGTATFTYIISNGSSTSQATVTVVVRGEPCSVTDTNTSNFNGTPIAAGNYLWFNANMSVSGLGATTAHIYFQNSTIRFTANGVTHTLAVPNSIVTFSPTATCITSSFDPATQTWNITSSMAGSDEVFITGLAFPIPAGGLPGGINPVSWTGTFLSDTPGVTVNWKWSAAVYTQFSTNYNALGVKPAHTSTCLYINSDHAGTPENYTQFVIGGARGGGGSEWTGSWSGTDSPAFPCSSGAFTTYTQGGWGSTPSGNNPGALLANNFARVYPSGVTVGGNYTLHFTSASAVHAFLPQGSSAAALRKSAVNPTGKITVFAGQTLALQLSVDFSANGVLKAGLGGLHVASGKLAGWTVSQVLSACNTALGGGAAPSGVTINDLNNIATLINQNYDNGTTDTHYLVP